MKKISTISKIYIAAIAFTIAASGACSSSNKVYNAGDIGDLKPIKLPAPQTETGKPLMKALKDRQTERSFKEKELPEQVLSNLLWAAFGINRPDSGKRTAPSAVDWQQIDIYVALKKGLYIYEAEGHSLNPVLARDIREDTVHTLQPLGFSVNDAPVHFIYVANEEKRNVLDTFSNEQEEIMWAAADTGCIVENVYLFCASEGLGTVVRGMVDRESLRKIMNLKKGQKITLCQSVGYPD